MRDAYCPALNDDQRDDLRDWCPPTPQYWRDKSLYGLLEQIWQWPEEIANESCEPTTDEEVEAHFNKLADEWEEDASNISSLTALVGHPKYREIVNMRWSVVPFLINDLQRKKRFWLPALEEITGIQPFDPSDSGNSKRMIESWVRWGKQKYKTRIG